MDKIEKIARAICRSQGHDPDAMVLPIRQPYFGAKGHVVVMTGLYGPVPSWQIYSNDAAAALSVIELSEPE